MLFLTITPLASAMDMDALFEKLREPATLVVEFTETRHLALLTEPLILRGEIRFARGSGVVFFYTEPERKTQIYRNRTRKPQGGAPHRRQTGGGGNEAMPEFLTAIFEGDQVGIEKNFTLDWQSEDGVWRLVLTPKSDWLRRHLATLTIRGTKPEIAAIELRFSSGDHHRIEITATRLNPAFTAEELRGLQ